MSKRMLEVRKKVDKQKLYSLKEAIELLKELKRTKFDETVEIHINLGIDPKQSSQTVRGAVVLPHGTGKTARVCVLAKGEKLKEAEKSGAEFYGAEELIEKIAKGWTDFDALIATPDMMKDIAKLGKILGPKGLMPNPKTGTVTTEIVKAVEEVKKGRVEFRNDNYGIIHCPVGKISFDTDKLIENIMTVVDTIIKLKPAQAKGVYLKNIYLSSTMGPSIRINPQEFTKK
ncbi:MAG: 50S ribosomal protein L1 [Endomicrobia bacterium]|nr:50S ribosomal protein L1 [Endomicrobiia bacterium]MCX7940934.1 50S ribosomal protein L1 [Endomicrobiia bacterium]MDW8055665.1 50S ribosomal protein L1 [Elusimicrobiota bacterium]